MKRLFRSWTWLEWSVLAAVLGTLIALFIPATRWAASGERDVVIRVHAFDGETHKPLAGAGVSLISGPYRLTGPPLASEIEANERSQSAIGTTNSDGEALVTGTFSSTSGYQNPKGSVGLHRGWLVVRAAGYGGVTFPVRHEPMPRPLVLEMKEVPVSIGLFRTQEGRSMRRDGQ